MAAKTDSRVIVALDFPDASAALAFAKQLDPSQCRVKVGKELFTAAGPMFVAGLVHMGFDVFLDLKFHDIPNTVAGACRAAAKLGVWMMNVHASGGRAMLEAAREAVPTGPEAPKLVAITLLTSLEQKDLDEIGITGTPEEVVLRLAKLTQSCGLDGVVCSGQEAESLRAQLGQEFALVTPGIRLPEGDVHDQVRILTPEKAIQSGASYLVVGRPITKAKDPLAALVDFNSRVASALQPAA